MKSAHLNSEHEAQAAVILYIHTVGWSDLAFFAIFEKLHISADIFLGGQFPKKRQTSPRACTLHEWQSFHFQKIAGAFNMNIFCENLQNPSLYFKEQWKIRKLEIKSCLIFIFFLQKWSKRFLI